MLQRVPVAVDLVDPVDPAVVPVVDEHLPAGRLALHRAPGCGGGAGGERGGGGAHDQECCEGVAKRTDHAKPKTELTRAPVGVSLVQCTVRHAPGGTAWEPESPRAPFDAREPPVKGLLKRSPDPRALSGRPSASVGRRCRPPCSPAGQRSLPRPRCSSLHFSSATGPRTGGCSGSARWRRSRPRCSPSEARLPAPRGAGAIAFGLLAALTAWVGLTMWWSIAPDLSWAAFDRLLAYGAIALLGLVATRAPRPARTAAAGLGAAARPRARVGPARQGHPLALPRRRPRRAPAQPCRLLELACARRRDGGAARPVGGLLPAFHPAARASGALLVYLAELVVVLTYSRAGIAVAGAGCARLAGDRPRPPRDAGNARPRHAGRRARGALDVLATRAHRRSAALRRPRERRRLVRHPALPRRGGRLPARLLRGQSRGGSGTAAVVDAGAGRRRLRWSRSSPSRWSSRARAASILDEFRGAKTQR